MYATCMSNKMYILIPCVTGTWKPSVEIVGAPPTGPAPLGATYTKTSLAYSQQSQVFD